MVKQYREDWCHVISFNNKERIGVTSSIFATWFNNIERGLASPQMSATWSNNIQRIGIKCPLMVQQYREDCRHVKCPLLGSTISRGLSSRQMSATWVNNIERIGVTSLMFATWFNNIERIGVTSNFRYMVQQYREDWRHVKMFSRFNSNAQSVSHVACFSQQLVWTAASLGPRNEAKQILPCREETEMCPDSNFRLVALNIAFLAFSFLKFPLQTVKILHTPLSMVVAKS